MLRWYSVLWMVGRLGLLGTRPSSLLQELRVTLRSDSAVQTRFEELSGTSTVPRTAHHIALFVQYRTSHDRNMKYDSLSCFLKSHRPLTPFKFSAMFLPSGSAMQSIHPLIENLWRILFEDIQLFTTRRCGILHRKNGVKN